MTLETSVGPVMKLRRRTIAVSVISAFAAFAASDLSAQGVRGFGTPQGKLPPRGFGNPKGEEALRQQFPVAAASIIGEDRQQAQWQIDRTDGNGDGIVTAAEWERSGYQTPRHFFYHDLNGDGILTHYEHTIGYARWRRRNELRAEARESAARASRPQKQPPESTAALQAPAAIDPQVAERQRQAAGLAGYIMQVYDVNSNNVVERSEFNNRYSSYGNLASADQNGDGTIERAELTTWLQNRLPPLSKLAFGMQSRDADNDGQVSLREYSEQISETSLAEFNRWDRDGDGFITPQESRRQPQPQQNEYSSEPALVIRPNGMVVADLWIDSEIEIGDLDVRISIAKDNDNFMQLDLVAPNHRRVPLYDGGWLPWRGAYIFENTLIDDEAVPIKGTLKAPPVPRAFRPPGVDDNERSSLGDLRGASTRGTWRLVVRNQNDRVGILNRWSLIVTPAESAP